MVLPSLILLILSEEIQCSFGLWKRTRLSVFGFSFKCQSFRLQSFLITMCLPFFSQQSELLGYIDPQFATPHLRFPIQSLSLSQSPSLILQGLVSEQQVQNDLHAENEFWQSSWLQFDSSASPRNLTKGQIKSEWIYEVIDFPN